jgi:LemA protein
MPLWLKIVIGVTALTAVFAMWIFNRLIALRVRSNNAWSDLDVQLKRRADLVPPLFATVRGYAAHESSTLQSAIEARTKAQAAHDLQERAQRETIVSHELHRLVALAEAYPNLKADQMFLSLHAQLVEVVDHLQSARRYYNAVVRDYNTLTQLFPHSIIAALFRFKPREFFEIEEAQIAPPVVNLGEAAP